ncbi:hypothetical protein SDC9_132349 [bioreactor metagenome]|uniref:Uncharacterized protein n=1 Tax=bioreactor metagenome TaxID=1076179 RepID=A0A645D7N7_9ZZZZ
MFRLLEQRPFVVQNDNFGAMIGTSSRNHKPLPFRQVFDCLFVYFEKNCAHTGALSFRDSNFTGQTFQKPKGFLGICCDHNTPSTHGFTPIQFDQQHVLRHAVQRLHFLIHV